MTLGWSLEEGVVPYLPGEHLMPGAIPQRRCNVSALFSLQTCGKVCCWGMFRGLVALILPQGWQVLEFSYALYSQSSREPNFSFCPSLYLLTITESSWECLGSFEPIFSVYKCTQQHKSQCLSRKIHSFKELWTQGGFYSHKDDQKSPCQASP